jgi:FixJ family two-component response regulator
MTEPTVYIVDDDASICEGLSNLLESVGIRAQCFGSAEEFRDNLKDVQSGCLLLDARLPGVSGVEFQEDLRRLGAQLPIIFMTAHGDVPMVRKVMKAGAIEFLTKPFQKEELLHAIEIAFAQDRERREGEAIVTAIKTRIASLTDREREVMSMVTAGMLNKQIASEITVKIHRRRVMDGMQAGSLAELVKMCERVSFPSRTAKA